MQINSVYGRRKRPVPKEGVAMAEDEEYFEDAELDFDEPEGDDDYDFGDQGGWVDDDPETITLEYDDGTSEKCDVLGGFPV